MVDKLYAIHQFELIKRDPDSCKRLEDLVFEEVQESFLASYLSERKIRPELLNLVQEDAFLLEDYLKLNAQQRAQVEKWRKKAPEFLEGDFEAEPAINLSRKSKNVSKKTFNFYKETHARKAITKTVELYIKHQPTPRKKPVPITTWFQCYDPRTAQNLKPRIKGKIQNLGTPPANKYYAEYGRLKRKNQIEDSFEDWIIKQIRPELKEQLQQTPHYTQKLLTLEQTVTLYIQHQPTSRMGAVPITTWFIT